MIIMLTGERKIGKSTVIRKVLEIISLSIGGFYTGFDPTCKTEPHLLYMQRADLQIDFSEKYMVASLSKDSKIGDTQRFDELGCRFLSESEGFADIIIMDELGFLEKDAELFRKAVFKALDSKIPVLGVIREGFPGWTEQIAEREDVLVIKVTEENRQELPQIIVERFKRELEL